MKNWNEIHRNGAAANRSGLDQVLEKMNQAGIHTKEQLCSPACQALYDEFGQELLHYLSGSFLYSKSGSSGKGNQARMRFLKTRGIAQEDLVTELAEQIIRVLDRILEVPLEKQFGYLYSIADHRMIDRMRRESNDLRQTLSLDGAMGENNDGEACSLLDYLEADNADPAQQLMQQSRMETILLNVVKHLADKPAQLFAVLCRDQLRMSNLTTCTLLQKLGPEQANAAVMREISREYQVSMHTLMPCMSDKPATEEDFLLHTGSPEKTCRQLTRLANRGRTRLRTNSSRSCLEE